MKLRIKGNSIRLRLSQSEIALLQTEKLVTDHVSFGNSKLQYQLRESDISDIHVSFENGLIDIEASNRILKPLLSADEVGFDATLQFDGQEPLYILIEKDFKCLTVREHEDESDLFENPSANHEC